MAAASLKLVSTSMLQQLRDAVASERIHVPIDRETLISHGFRHQLDAIAGALAGHRSAACLAILDVALAEREDRQAPPDLVWSGPDGASGGARDTAVVLRELFEGARENVILAGYSFEGGSHILEPLHQRMVSEKLDVRFFIDVEQVDAGIRWEKHLLGAWNSFLKKAWVFGDPYPDVYYDVRASVPGRSVRQSTQHDPGFVSLHAKCVVVDGRRSLVSSANFTRRAHERNIECGVLIDDPHFSRQLASQWLSLIEGGLVKRIERSALEAAVLIDDD